MYLDFAYKYFLFDNDINRADIHIAPVDLTFCLINDQLSKIPANADTELCDDYSPLTGVTVEVNTYFCSGGNVCLIRITRDNYEHDLNLI